MEIAFNMIFGIVAIVLFVIVRSKSKEIRHLKYKMQIQKLDKFKNIQHDSDKYLTLKIGDTTIRGLVEKYYKESMQD